MRILIDPGHGGADPGATYGGVREADLNLDTGRRLALILGAERTRQSDTTISLADRVDCEHRLKPDCFVSIHHDANPNPLAQGFTVYHNPGSLHGQALASAVETAMRQRLAEFNRRSRGAQSTDDPSTAKVEHFYVLKNTGSPAILVECGFVSNDLERAWLMVSEHRQAMAEGIAAGVLAWIKSLELNIP